MKPPLRRRLAPARYVTSPGAAGGAAAAGTPPRGAGWSAREKRALLAALRAQAALGAAELDPRRLRERLPRRSEAEVLALVSQLRGRVAREALRSEFRQCLDEQRRRRAEPPAPIEVWTDLAEALGEPLEGAAAAAFSQVLTVAGTEPAGPDPPPDLAVDFERLYGHLALLARGGPAPPPPPPAEAAVLLALLAALPPELPLLELEALGRHLRGAFAALAAPREPPPRRDAPQDEETPLDDVTTSGDTPQHEETPSDDVTTSRDAPNDKETRSDDITMSGDTPEHKETPLDDVTTSGDNPRDKETPLDDVITSGDTPKHKETPLGDVTAPQDKETPSDDVTVPMDTPRDKDAPQDDVTGRPRPPWAPLGLCPLNLFLVPLRLLARAPPRAPPGPGHRQ